MQLPGPPTQTHQVRGQGGLPVLVLGHQEADDEVGPPGSESTRKDWTIRVPVPTGSRSKVHSVESPTQLPAVR